ncbi:MAG: hypothetical protein K0S08_1629 [Gammaproteobacteria bacterium]|jgi:hypothetical protein|nr:hypothetical protein [Gammaproteobacteria bacterium]
MGFSLTQVLDLSLDVASKLGALAGGIFSVTKAGISVQTQTPIAADTMHHATAIFAASAGAQVASGVFHSIRQHSEIQERRLRIAGAGAAATVSRPPSQVGDASAPLLMSPDNGLAASKSVIAERGGGVALMTGGAAMVAAGFYEIVNNPITGGNLILAGCAVAAFGAVGLKHSYDRELSDVVTVEQRTSLKLSA